MKWVVRVGYGLKRPLESHLPFNARYRSTKFLILLLGSFALLVTVLKDPLRSANSQFIADYCSEEKQLRFCVKKGEVTVESGTNVVLEFSFENRSRKDISFIGKQTSSYSIVVKDDSGETLKTKRERALSKIEISEKEAQDAIASSFVSRRPDPIVLKPKDKSHERIQLSNLYDLAPGTYQVDVTRKVVIPNKDPIELTLENLKVHVKETKR